MLPRLMPLMIKFRKLISKYPFAAGCRNDPGNTHRKNTVLRCFSDIYLPKAPAEDRRGREWDDIS
jgi:hypothetical protein